MRSALRGPAHQLAVRMRINNCTHGRPAIIIIAMPAMHHAPATARAPRVCTLVPFIVEVLYLIHQILSYDLLFINKWLGWVHFKLIRDQV